MRTWLGASEIPDENEMIQLPVRYGRVQDVNGFTLELQEKPTDNRLYKVTIGVLDLNESIDFYSKVLQMKLLRRRSNVNNVPKSASMCAYLVMIRIRYNWCWTASRATMMRPKALSLSCYTLTLRRWLMSAQVSIRLSSAPPISMLVWSISSPVDRWAYNWSEFGISYCWRQNAILTKAGKCFEILDPNGVKVTAEQASDAN